MSDDGLVFITEFYSFESLNKVAIKISGELKSKDESHFRSLVEQKGRCFLRKNTSHGACDQICILKEGLLTLSIVSCPHVIAEYLAKKILELLNERIDDMILKDGEIG